ncbi:GntR family transcriptional regulator [Clostridium rectalis]|uniref:GntR family transcriptional regulator n=1 Tax=Clostridium rectalis TaxID=2040295 RepID=UPI000F644898|nr:GntR family transcriptional regulator [Clostridium rectalis]
MNIIISNSSREPIYEQITKQIKNLILMGSIKEGDALPSIRNLAQGLKISVITTKRAYEELEKEGFIETVPGKGSFVASQNKELLRESKIRSIEEKFSQIVEESKLINLGLKDLEYMLRVIYEES